MLRRERPPLLGWLWPWVTLALLARAQIDPAPRELIQLGYNQSIQGQSPLAGYAFYYLNRPDFPRTNLTLRLALAPIYLDTELGLRQALGPHTDLAFGLAGGGFAHSYSELRAGKYWKEESFLGHGGEISASVYHLLNPAARIPLNAVLRTSLEFTTYARDERTAPTFVVPDRRLTSALRAGLRWGGQEPMLLPAVGLELSLWYEAQYRPDHEFYGYAGDREIEATSHRLWGRALLSYTLPEAQHAFGVSLTLGTTRDADRFSAYRLGGVLPLASEFPLAVPGYYYQELSAQRLALISASYSMPVAPNKRWHLLGVGSTAAVDYAPGLDQAGHWHSGLGGGLRYLSASGAWQWVLGAGYGFDAPRSHGRGAFMIGAFCQLNLGQTRSGFFQWWEKRFESRGLFHLFSR